MDFQFSEQHQSIREAVKKVCDQFGDDYWLQRDTDGRFPHEFSKAMADGGWLGIAMPEIYGGSGLGVTEAAIMLQTVAASGAGMSGCSSIHLNIFGLNPVVVFGNDEQKKRHLPRIISGEDRACFGVTEPDAGLDTTRLSLKAEWDGSNYIVTGKKVWTSTAQEANKVLLITRTTPRDKTKRPVDGLSLFYTDLDRNYVDVREIEKMGRKCVDSNEVFYDGLPVPKEDLIGEEGKGFYYLLHGLNPERVLAGAGCVGLGQVALEKATAYAKDRVVFDRPIGKNQGIQHPLAESWIELEAANLMTFKAATLYDQGIECAKFANAAKYLAAEAAFNACTRAMNTFGGYGYAKEYHVERYMREVMAPRVAPVSPQLILCYIAERVLGLPKSY